LQRRGLSEAQIANIWSGNVLRVMRQAQDYAARQAR
jgi:membrane dipeptidase